MIAKVYRVTVQTELERMSFQITCTSEQGARNIAMKLGHNAGTITKIEKIRTLSH